MDGADLPQREGEQQQWHDAHQREQDRRRLLQPLRSARDHHTSLSDDSREPCAAEESVQRPGGRLPVSSSKGPEMRTTSLRDHVPRRVTTTKRSPAMPARRVASFAGAHASVRGASPSVKLTTSIEAPSAATAKTRALWRSATKSRPPGPTSMPASSGPLSTVRRSSP